VVFHLLAVYLLMGNNHALPVNFSLSYGLVVGLGFALSRILCVAVMPLVKFNFEKREANIMAIASVGGHWIELLRIMPLFNGKNVTFVSNKANLSNTVSDYKFHTVPDASRSSVYKLLKCIVRISGLILFLRPQVIITTGAAPGLLGIFVGKILGIKTIWIDSIANVDKLSLSGLIALWTADKVYTQWEHLASPKITYSGNIL
jgi:UDP-N-acetylglucosamine:LPS N-acetylglucosamine transferase